MAESFDLLAMDSMAAAAAAAVATVVTDTPDGQASRADGVGGGAGQLEPAFAQFRDSTRFWIQRVAVPLIMVIGVFGNSITVIIMTRRRMRSTTNMYLAALAFVDMLYLVLTFLLGLSHYPNMAKYEFYHYWQVRPFLMMLTDACSNTSVWLTVTFTIERFIAVKYPIRGKVWCTEARARMLILCVFVFGVLFAAPVPFEWQVIEKRWPVVSDNDNSSSSNHNDGANHNEAPAAVRIETPPPPPPPPTQNIDNEQQQQLQQPSIQSNASGIETRLLALDYSAFGKNETYKTIYYWSTAVIFYFIPLISLTLFNGFLIRSVHESQRERNKMTSTGGGCGANSNYHRQSSSSSSRQQNNDKPSLTRAAKELEHTTTATSTYSRSLEPTSIHEESRTSVSSLAKVISNDDDDDYAYDAAAAAAAAGHTMRNGDNYPHGSGGGGGELIVVATSAKPANGIRTCHQMDSDIKTSSSGEIQPPDGGGGGGGRSRRSRKSDSVLVLSTAAAAGRQQAALDTKQPPPDDELKRTRASTRSNFFKRATLMAASTKDGGQQHQNNNSNHHHQAAGNNCSNSQERRITIMLIAVVILFLFCQIPTAAMLLYTSVHEPAPNTNEHALVLAFGNIFNFLMAVNAAGNFILYSFLSKKYRRTFVILFCNCFKRRQPAAVVAAAAAAAAASAVSKKDNNSNDCAKLLQRNKFTTGVRNNASFYHQAAVAKSTADGAAPRDTLV